MRSTIRNHPHHGTADAAPAVTHLVPTRTATAHRATVPRPGTDRPSAGARGTDHRSADRPAGSSAHSHGTPTSAHRLRPTARRDTPPPPDRAATASGWSRRHRLAPLHVPPTGGRP